MLPEPFSAVPAVERTLDVRVDGDRSNMDETPAGHQVVQNLDVVQKTPELRKMRLQPLFRKI
jgi:hypothetical protein